jgi:tight adherence protein B
MYFDPKILLLISVVVFFALIASLSCLWILSRQKKRFIAGRYRDLALIPLNSQDADASAQALATQRVLRERLNELEKSEKSSHRTRVNNLILRSGLKYNYRRYIINSLIVFVSSFFLIFLLSKILLIAILVSLLLGAVGQNMYLSFLFKRRQKQFTADFAGALDIIVRGVTVGLSINESMKAVAYEAQGPVSEEFRRIVDGQAMGLDFEDVLEDAIHRMPTAEFRFFSIVMQIQRQTGGSMAKTLADLSALLRGRKEMRDKIMALSSEAKSSAFIIGCLPLFVTGILFLMSPDFLDPLLNQTIGQVMIGAGLALMLIGMFVMRAMINFKF